MKINNHVKRKQRFTISFSRETKHDIRAAKKHPIYQKFRRRVSTQKALIVMFLANPDKAYLARLAFFVRNDVI